MRRDEFLHAFADMELRALACLDASGKYSGTRILAALDNGDRVLLWHAEQGAPEKRYFDDDDNGILVFSIGGGQFVTQYIPYGIIRLLRMEADMYTQPDAK